MYKFRLFPAIFIVASFSLAIRVVGMLSGGSSAFSPSEAYAAEAEEGAVAGAQEATATDQDNSVAQDNNSTDSSTIDAQGNRISANRLDLPSSNNRAYGLPTDQELILISQLRERRQQLDRREQKINLQEQLLAGTETRINEKIAALEALEVKIKEHLRVFEEQEAEQLKNVVLVYEAMKPADAATRFQELDIKVQVDLAMRMKNKKFAAILAKMQPAKATALTIELATRAEPPTIESMQNS